MDHCRGLGQHRRRAMAARQEPLALSGSATTPSRGRAAPIQRIHSETDRSSALSFTKCDEHPHASENQSYVLFDSVASALRKQVPAVLKKPSRVDIEAHWCGLVGKIFTVS